MVTKKNLQSRIYYLQAKIKNKRNYWRNQTFQLRADLICIKLRIEGLAKRAWKNNRKVDWKRNMVNIAKNIRIHNNGHSKTVEVKR